MRRIMVGATLLAGGLVGTAPRTADAQLTASVHVSWQWNDDGWHRDRVVDGYVHVIDRVPRRGGGYGPPARVRPAPRPRFHVPPGHLPPPGMCRAWVVGRSPGHQPAPTSCARAFRIARRPGVVILHTPAPGRAVDLHRWDGPDRDRWDDWNEGNGDRWGEGRRHDDRRDDRDGRRRGRGRGG
jgi:hypothetical protein